MAKIGLPRARIAERLASIVPAKPFLLRGKIGVITFSFDDVPRNAFAIGGEILNRHEIGGTFYVAGGLTGTVQHGLPQHTEEDIRAAVRQGHEIASHGYAHVRYTELKPDEIDEDLEKNQRYLTDLLGDSPINFAYPFGARVFSNKRQLANRFVTARGIVPGINGRVCDLSDLRANPIFTHKMTERRIQSLIERTGATGGWLIFYTHDVSDTPTEWGTTPGLLEFAVRQAHASRCRVLPVRNAIGAISFSSK